MTTSTLTTMTGFLLCFSMILQGIEIFWLARSPAALKIWNLRNLQADLHRGLPFPNRWINILFADHSLSSIALIQVMMATAGFFVQGPYIFGGLFFTHLLITLRFRGSFNGGSDMMTFLVLTGMIIQAISNAEIFQKLGLLYIAIHVVLSYLRAGFSKITQEKWRTGIAIAAFLGQSLYPDVRKVSLWLHSHRGVCFLICWIVILFELGVIAIPFVPGLAVPYFLCALVFHFLNYLIFGLNRFFWIWLCGWPALIYSAALLNF